MGRRMDGSNAGLADHLPFHFYSRFLLCCCCCCFSFLLCRPSLSQSALRPFHHSRARHKLPPILSLPHHSPSPSPCPGLARSSLSSSIAQPRQHSRRLPLYAASSPLLGIVAVSIILQSNLRRWWCLGT